jgi:hypothetical protein
MLAAAAAAQHFQMEQVDRAAVGLEIEPVMALTDLPILAEAAAVEMQTMETADQVSSLLNMQTRLTT